MRIIANLLILLGTVGVLVFAATKIDAIVYNWLARSEYDQFDRMYAEMPDVAVKSDRSLLQQPAPAESDIPVPIPIITKATLRTARPSISRVSGETIIGRLEIPRVGVSAFVLEGIDARTLLRGVGHLPQTALPGEPGNFAVAGHRDTVFRNLRSIANGDTIRIVTHQGEFQYMVTMIAVVDPHDTTVTRQTAEPTFTLITCFPFTYFGPAPKRFVVQAELR
jgi:LPXTG-site transpeptidase (sortase) family protein